MVLHIRDESVDLGKLGNETLSRLVDTLIFAHLDPMHSFTTNLSYNLLKGLAAASGDIPTKDFAAYEADRVNGTTLNSIRNDAQSLFIFPDMIAGIICPNTWIGVYDRDGGLTEAQRQQQEMTLKMSLGALGISYDEYREATCKVLAAEIAYARRDGETQDAELLVERLRKDLALIDRLSPGFTDRMYSYDGIGGKSLLERVLDNGEGAGLRKFLPKEPAAKNGVKLAAAAPGGA